MLLDELWKQLLAGFVVACGTFFTWGLSRYRDRRARDGEVRFWQAHAREWKDLSGDYRMLVSRRVIEDSDVDNHTKTVYLGFEAEYDRLTEKYQYGPEGKK